jgi:hypothetical protein
MRTKLIVGLDLPNNRKNNRNKILQILKIFFLNFMVFCYNVIKIFDISD